MQQPPSLPPVSVVICTRDRPDTIGAALDSVLAQDYPDFEVLVIDQSRGDETAQIVDRARERFPRIRSVRLRTPGLSRAYNAGVREAAADLLAFTDDDVVAPPDWLRSIVNAFASHPGVGLIYGQVLVAPELEARENRDGVTPALGIPERRILDREHGFRVFGMGANFAARRALFERVGDFDEVLGGGGPLQSSQDFDFVYRVFKSGESTLLEPDVIVYHHGFRSHEEWPATMRSYGIGVGGFCFKHVRLGDPYATWLLCQFLALAAARVAKRVLTLRSAGVQWAYLSNIVAGMRRSLRFPIDRRRRLYLMEQ
ncbi:MAG TPA: glycosyltransferase family A protein [Candidatus Dormibacteraeota bacterium]|nr:glycosyltransferase family A protein [Candidatus Dormibacteraeota bacterium]